MRFIKFSILTVLKGLIYIVRISLFLVSGAILAQSDYEITNYTRKSGLPSDDIRKVYKDSRGLLWLGTSEGLVNYDGYSFTVVSGQATNNKSLTLKSVYDISEATNGNLFVGTFQGLCEYDRVSSTFTAYLKDTALDAHIVANFFLVSKVDPIGNVWNLIPHNYGFNVFRSTTKSFDTPDMDLAGFCVSRSGLVWKVKTKDSSYSIVSYNPRNGKEKVLATYAAPLSLGAKESIRKITEDREGNLWFGSEYGISKIDTKSGQKVDYLTAPGSIDGLPPGKINAFEFDEEGNVWLGTDSSGVIRFDPATQKCLVIKNIKADKNSLISNQISCLKYDNGSCGLALKRVYQNLQSDKKDLPI